MTIHFIILVLSVPMSFFLLAHIIYGRITREPLVGKVDKDDPAYKIFLKQVDSNFYLVIFVLMAIDSVISLIAAVS
ncbi:MAG TPA: hypothetical protein VLA88_05580 [Candidatus Saccharimonadales bacterium]|nr:hypothetical protein [Candidatus Saccharimonadales bacterium]